MALERQKLVFVDDEPDILLILSETFQDLYDVQVAESGARALEILAQGPVDLLVTDQKMPHMSGVELIARARELYPDLTCLMLTAYSDPPDLIEVINRGPVYRFLTKPWDTQDLLQTVDNALAHARLIAENRALLEETQRRLAALEAFSDVSAAASAFGGWEDVVAEVAELLARVVPLEVSATLLHASVDRAPTLTVRCTRPLGREVLERLADDTRDAFNTLTGGELTESDVQVRFTGPGIGDDADANGELASMLFVPLDTDGAVSGLVVAAARDADAFGRDDERILDLLANRFARALADLKSSNDDERRVMSRTVEGLRDGMVLTDPAGEVIVANRAARELLGLEDPHVVSGRVLRDRLGFDPHALAREWERLGTHSLAQHLEVGDRQLQTLVSPVADGRGGLEGIVVTLSDVTEHRRRERAQQQFLRDVAHELRTPLTSVHGTLDLLQGQGPGPLTDKQQRFLDLIQTSVRRVNSLVDELIESHRSADASLRVRPQRLDLGQHVNDAALRFRPTIEQTGATLDVALPEVEVSVRADPQRLDQVLENLLANAARFVPDGGRVLLEVFAPDDVNNMVGFRVWNTGSRIPADELEKVFEAYHQAEPAQPGRPRGTGLGLPICRRIVEAHGGRVWAESPPDEGVSFIVVLPRAEIIEKAERELVAASAPTHGHGGDRATVLVVDDDRSTTYTLKSVLLAAGFEVLVAHRADDAVALARERKPSVVISDVRMPDVDGVALIEILRHDPETRGTPIIAVSGYDEGERARRARAHAFLEKPLEPARLVGTISELAFGRMSVGQGILVVMEDERARETIAETLIGHGFHVAKGASLQEARQQSSSFRPDLLVLDLPLPDGDGIEVLESIKRDRHTSGASIIVLSDDGGTDAKVGALRRGADDYLVKPFDAEELVARIETVLRRREIELAASPTTRLPGSRAIDAEVERRVAARTPFSLCYLDLDDLKAFNDTYGFAKADAVVLQTGDLLREIVSAHGQPEDFIGHIAGDDFVLVTTPTRAADLSTRIIAAFDRLVPLYYSRADRSRGYIEGKDRDGNPRRFPLMGLSIVAITDEGGRYGRPADLSQAAAALKKKAKAQPGSVFVPDDHTPTSTSS